MTTVVPFPSKLTPVPAPIACEPKKLPYSFDMLQTTEGGLVAIDACVPADIALAMLEMLQARFPTAA